jgi:hypothetical protein
MESIFEYDDNLIKNVNHLSVDKLIELIDEKINNKYNHKNIYDKFNYHKFIHIKNYLINKFNLTEDINIKNDFKLYVSSNDIFNYEKYNEYYNNKMKVLKIIHVNDLNNISSINDFNILDQDFRKKIGKNIFILNILFNEFNKLNAFYNYYNNKNKHISLIEISFDDYKFNDIKKVLGSIFFKNIIIKKLYSQIKIIKQLFFKYQNLLNKIDNTFNIVEFNNTFTFYDYHYSEDKIMSSGETCIYNILNEIYIVNPSLLYFKYDYVLPIKFIHKLRADFFCIFINKHKKIQKIIIEVNGEQHYSFNTFFNDKTLIIRDNIKKEFCKHNNIIFIELKYNQLNDFHSIITLLLYSS